MKEEKIVPKGKNITIPHGLAEIYSQVDGLSLQNLFCAKIETFPCCTMFTQDNRSGDYHLNPEGLFNYLMENTPEDENIEHVIYETYNLTTEKTHVGFCMTLNKSHIFIRVENSPSESYILSDTAHFSDAVKIRDLIKEKFYVQPEPERNNLFKIAATQGGYTLIKSNVREVEDFDIDAQYNDDFKKEDKKITSFLAENGKGGLIILHGEKGTGKSTYIRHLININDDKKFIFVPATLIPLLGEPSFGTFLQSLTNSVIILEDCENVIRDRKSNLGSSAAVSLLLNMTDGLLEDDLGIKFICTFNEDIRNIDSALLRKGRLISKYEFQKLSVEKSNALLATLFEGENGESPITKTPMTLADIYNYEEDSYDNKKTSII